MLNCASLSGNATLDAARTEQRRIAAYVPFYKGLRPCVSIYQIEIIDGGVCNGQ